MSSWPPPGDDARAQYAAHGVGAMGRLLDDVALAQVRAAMDELLPSGTTGPYATIIHDGWRRSPALAALVPAVARAAAAVIGAPALVLFHEHLLWKPPGGEDMAWHQDYSYLPLDRPDGCTLWIALDDCDADNGCLYYAYDSHRDGELRAAWGIWADDDPRATLPPITIDAPGVAAPTAAGAAVAHDTLLLHRSPGNRSSRPRRAWALSLVSPDARWSPRHAPHPRSAIEPRAEGDPLEPDLLAVDRG